jgi:hypothetical protein
MGRAHVDEAALRQSVREHAAAGVDQIKLYARLDAKMLSAGAAEARLEHKYVLAHLGAGGKNLGAVNLPEAVAAGINEFEHFVGLETAWRDASPEEEEAEIDELVAAQLAQVPTLLVHTPLNFSLSVSLSLPPSLSFSLSAVNQGFTTLHC